MANPKLEAETPLQKTMVRAKAWLPAQLDQLFKERKTDGLAFLAGVAEGRDVVGSPKAYDLLHVLLFRLVDRPKTDVAPLVPLLRRICEHETYNPGGTFRFEAVRMNALRLLARRRDPAARALVARFVGDFPARRDRTDGPALVDVLAEAAADLGASEYAPRLRALLDTMLPAHDPPQRRAQLADAEKSLRVLERKAKKPGAGRG